MSAYEIQSDGKPQSDPATTSQIVTANNIVTDHVLCQCCQRVIRESKLLRSIPGISSQPQIELFNHFPGLEQLTASAVAGCHLCNIALRGNKCRDGLLNCKACIVVQISTTCRAFVEDETSFLELQFYVRYVEVYDSEVYGHAGAGLDQNLEYPLSSACRIYHFSAEEKAESGAANEETINFGKLSLKNQLAAILQNTEPAHLSTSTGSEHSLALAKTWLARCVQHHTTCSAAKLLKSSGPSRLVDVGEVGKLTAPRLCQCNDFRAPVQYLALSHCWGSANILKLTNANLKSLCQKLSWDALPLTFQHALVITRKLGYRFIWIDSLCIIQDSKVDWRNESAKMGSIYQNSVCTISALAASDSHGGCFRSMNPLSSRPCRITGPLPMGLYLWPVGKGNADPDTSRQSAQRRHPLLTRAWAVQERILSPRTLHFQAESMMWECLECDASLQYPGIHTERISSKRSFYNMLSSPDSERITADKLLFEWGNIVGAYTTGQLTFADDKLVALEGITTLIKSRLGFDSVAGLLKDFLLFCLSWRAVNPGTRLKIGMPSWSWASLEAPVSYTQLTRLSYLAYDLQHRRVLDLVWIAEILELKEEFSSISDFPGSPLKKKNYVIYLRAPLKRSAISWATALRAGAADSLSLLELTGEDTGEQYMCHLKPDVSFVLEDQMWLLQISVFQDEQRTRWGCLIVTPRDTSRNEWMRLGYLEIFSNPPTRPFFTVEDVRSINIV